MGRAGFGGTDYTSTFADLYAQSARTQARVAQSATNASTYTVDVPYGASPRAVAAAQAAEDQNMADQWANGLISDDEWLAYIAKRVEGTSGNPKENVKWVKYQRHYTTIVNDGRAKYAFDNGGSIADYIAYQKTALATLDPGSQEWRDRSTAIGKLQDQQIQGDIATQATRIKTAIQNGEKSWGDLAAYYKGAMKTLPSGDYRDSVAAALADATTNADRQTSGDFLAKQAHLWETGKLTGAQYAKSIRDTATKYWGHDPKTYYELLDSALPYQRLGSRRMDPSTGKVLGGGGAGAGGGGYARKTVNKMIDEYQAERNRLTAMFDALKEKPNQRYVTDPWTGKTYSRAQVSSGLVDDTMAAFDNIAKWQAAKGDMSAATDTLVSKRRFLTDTVQPLNATNHKAQLRHLTESGRQAIEAAVAAGATNPDPGHVLTVAQGVAASIRKWVTAQYDKVSTYGIFGMPGEAGPIGQVVTARPPETTPPPDYYDSLLAFADGLDARATGDPSHFDTKLEVMPIIAQDDGTPLFTAAVLTALNKSVNDARADQLALASGASQLVAAADGIHVVPLRQGQRAVVGPGGSTIVAPESQFEPGALAATARQGGLDMQPASETYAGDVLIPYVFDTPSGPVKGWAVARPDQLAAYQGYVATVTNKKLGVSKGAPIPASKLDAAQKAGIAKLALVGNGLYRADVPAYMNGGQAIPAHIFYYDPKTNRIADGGTPERPLPAPVLFLNTNNGVVSFDDKGQATVHLDPAATWSAFGYSGTNPGGATAFMLGEGDSGHITTVDTTGAHIRQTVGQIDANGVPLVDPTTGDLVPDVALSENLARAHARDLLADGQTPALPGMGVQAFPGLPGERLGTGFGVGGADRAGNAVPFASTSDAIAGAIHAAADALGITTRPSNFGTSPGAGRPSGAPGLTDSRLPVPVLTMPGAPTHTGPDATGMIPAALPKIAPPKPPKAPAIPTAPELTDSRLPTVKIVPPKTVRTPVARNRAVAV